MNSSFSHGYDITVDPMIARNNCRRKLTKLQT